MTMMTYPVRLVLAAAVFATVASAQEVSSAPPVAAPAAPTDNKPAFAADAPTGTPANAAPAAPKKPRAVSSEVAAIMATGLPKYNPPPKPVVKAEEEVDSRDVDKPKNDIPRLPSVVVRGNRVPIFRERDLNTEKGLSQMAMRHYAGLNIPLIGFMNRPIALQMYRDEQRLSDIDELRKAASDAAMAGDTAGSDYIKRTGAESFVRRADFGSLGEKK